jgi:glucokinase
MQHSSMNLRIGVDIGGTHITAAMVDMDTRIILHESLVRKQVDPSGNAEQIIDEWTAAIMACNLHSPKQDLKIGISMPGPFDYEQGISLISGLHKFECLYGLNVKELLAKSLGTAASNIVMENDAICYLAGERIAGAGKGVEYVAGITLGTGLGSAIYRDHHYELGDLYCMPFRDSRAEDYLCSRWFVNEYYARTGILCKGAKELAMLAEQDDIAKELFAQFGMTLAEVFIAKFKSDFPAKIVVGGNIAHAWNLFSPSCKSSLSNFDTSLSKALLGENAALIGAVGSLD